MQLTAIDGPSAWLGADLARSDRWVRELTADDIAELDMALAAVEAVEPRVAAHPASTRLDTPRGSAHDPTSLRMPTPKRRDHLRRRSGTDRRWAGLMPFSSDGVPILGPVPDRDALFLAGGLASSGFGRGPMAGQMVAELVLGHQPDFDMTPVLRGSST